MRRSGMELNSLRSENGSDGIVSFRRRFIPSSLPVRVDTAVPTAVIFDVVFLLLKPAMVGTNYKYGSKSESDCMVPPLVKTVFKTIFILIGSLRLCPSKTCNFQQFSKRSSFFFVRYGCRP